MLRDFRLLTALLPLCMVVACSDGGTEPDEVSVVGTYTLREVGGSKLPSVAGGFSREVTEGSVTLNADQTFTHSVTVRETIGGSVIYTSYPNTGTYILNGTELRFLFLPTVGPADSGSGYEEFGSISGNRLTMLSQGIPFVFER